MSLLILDRPTPGPLNIVHALPDGSSSRATTTEADTPPLHELSAQLIDSGLEVAPAKDHDKQFVSHVQEGDKEVVNHDEKEVALHTQPVQSLDGRSGSASSRSCGLKRNLFYGLLVAVLVALALGVGLGVGLTSKNSDKSSSASSSTSTSSLTPTSTQSSSPTLVASDELKIGGGLDRSYYSSVRAWNGSGIAQVWQNFAQNFTDTLTVNEHEIVVYYQHQSGDIRWLRDSANTTRPWQPGPSGVAVVASDAKNSTPIRLAMTL